MIKEIIKKTYLLTLVNYLRQQQQLLAYKKGDKNPPPILKQRIVKEYARQFKLDTLIETGTYLGDMIWATKPTFRKIISIELDFALWQKATDRFARYDYISILHGNSGEVLADILDEIKQPCLFWLDGHYSEGFTAKGSLETPILQELQCILKHPVRGHVILIDDARCFGAEKDYPSLEELRMMFPKRDWNMEVKDDVIRICGC